MLFINPVGDKFGGFLSRYMQVGIPVGIGYLAAYLMKFGHACNVMDDEVDNKISKPVLKDDEESIRSELRSLRQTAVSLTVGEKESASALIKEWLEDNPNKEENPVE